MSSRILTLCACTVSLLFVYPNQAFAVKPDMPNLAETVELHTAEIAANAADIATNAADVSTNASGISTNAADVATNVSGISSNSSAIGSNAAGISSNASGIATNASAIAGNTSGIGVNSGLIGTINSDLEVMLGMIEENQSKQEHLALPTFRIVDSLTIDPDPVMFKLRDFLNLNPWTEPRYVQVRVATLGDGGKRITWCLQDDSNIFDFAQTSLLGTTATKEAGENSSSYYQYSSGFWVYSSISESNGPILVKFRFSENIFTGKYRELKLFVNPADTTHPHPGIFQNKFVQSINYTHTRYFVGDDILTTEYTPTEFSVKIGPDRLTTCGLPNPS